jgi:hypothetical protein
MNTALLSVQSVSLVPTVLQTTITSLLSHPTVVTNEYHGPNDIHFLSTITYLFKVGHFERTLAQVR